MVKLIQLKVSNFIKKNLEIFFLFLLLIISAIIIQFYNLQTKQTENEYLKVVRNSYFKKTIDHVFFSLNPRFEEINHMVQSGETLEKILKKNLVSESEIAKLYSIIDKDDLKRIKLNKIINITLDNSNKKNKKISNILIPISKTRKVKISKNYETNSFIKQDIVTNLNKTLVLKEGTIKSSLYRSASNLDIKPNVIIEFARLYGFQVDFQRDIRKNDSFQILYESYVDENGKVFSTGNIIYANLILRGQANQLYFYPKKRFRSL